MRSPSGGPAFPNEQGHTPEGTWNQTFDPGMSLLEYYAGRALPHARSEKRLMAQGRGENFVEITSESQLAAAAFDIAEAMVAEALKRKGGAA